MTHTGWGEIRTGWKILVATVVGAALGNSGLWFYTQGLFYTPVSEAFDVPISAITGAGLYGIPLAIGFAYPFGRLVDRWGTRIVSMIGIPVFASTIAACGLYQGPFWGFRLLLIAITILGLGASPTVYTRIASTNFSSARGKAIGLTLGGLGLSAFGLPAPLSYIIESHGYRPAYLLMAALALSALPLVLALVPRERSSATSAASVQAASAADEEPGWEARDALLTPRYILMIALFVTSCVATTMVFIPLSPMLQNFGQSPVWAANVVSFGGIGVIVGRVGIGILMDRFFPTLIAAVLFPITAAAFALLLVPDAPALWVITAFLAGAALGAEGDMVAMLVSRYFGLRPYATLYAIGYAFFGPTAAYIGPFIATKQFEIFDSYRPVVITAIVLFGIASVLALALPRKAATPKTPQPIASPLSK